MESVRNRTSWRIRQLISTGRPSRSCWPSTTNEAAARSARRGKDFFLTDGLVHRTIRIVGDRLRAASCPASIRASGSTDGEHSPLSERCLRSSKINSICLDGPLCCMTHCSAVAPRRAMTDVQNPMKTVGHDAMVFDLLHRRDFSPHRNVPARIPATRDALTGTLEPGARARGASVSVAARLGGARIWSAASPSRSGPDRLRKQPSSSPSTLNEPIADSE